jgi:ferredoxin-NADP reductase
MRVQRIRPSRPGVFIAGGIGSTPFMSSDDDIRSEDFYSVKQAGT